MFYNVFLRFFRVIIIVFVIIITSYYDSPNRFPRKTVYYHRKSLFNISQFFFNSRFEFWTT